MNADDEILIYLQSLLAHRTGCRAEPCASCLVLKGILEGIRYQMFSGPVYPEVMIAMRGAPAPSAAIERVADLLPPRPRRARGRTSTTNPDCRIHQ